MHYKLINKKESYSKEGFGNGFASKVDRFTGKKELKYVHFPRTIAEEAEKKVVSHKAKVLRLSKQAKTFNYGFMRTVFNLATQTASSAMPTKREGD